MELSLQGAAFVRHHEGFVDHWYLDPVGIPTIGVGFTWASASFREWWAENRPGKNFDSSARMTREEADQVLVRLMREEYGKAVNVKLPRLKQHQFDASASMTFNCGAGSLEWKWADALRAGAISTAAELLRTTAITAKGKRLQGLVNRRKEEAELLELGDYSIGKTYVSVSTDPMADGILEKFEIGDAVGSLQVTLANLGFYNGIIDGNFGSGTEEAVLAFQRANGLTADGKVGPGTFKALKLSPVRKPQPAAPAKKPNLLDAFLSLFKPRK